MPTPAELEAERKKAAEELERARAEAGKQNLTEEEKRALELDPQELAQAVNAHYGVAQPKPVERAVSTPDNQFDDIIKLYKEKFFDGAKQAYKEGYAEPKIENKFGKRCLCLQFTTPDDAQSFFTTLAESKKAFTVLDGETGKVLYQSKGDGKLLDPDGKEMQSKPVSPETTQRFKEAMPGSGTSGKPEEAPKSDEPNRPEL